MRLGQVCKYLIFIIEMLDLSSEIFVLYVFSQVLQTSLQLVWLLFHHGFIHTKMCLQVLPRALVGIECLSKRSSNDLI